MSMIDNDYADPNYEPTPDDLAEARDLELELMNDPDLWGEEEYLTEDDEEDEFVDLDEESMTALILMTRSMISRGTL